MKLRHLAFLTPLAAIAAAPTATPPAEGPGPRRGGPGRGHPLVRAMDLDHDGVLSATEITRAPRSLLALDTDGDGTLSAAELRPGRPTHAPSTGDRPVPVPAHSAGERPAGPPAGTDHPARAGGATRTPPTDVVLLALDANADGTLTAAEIANAARSLTALDLDKDGQLSRAELRPLPPGN